MSLPITPVAEGQGEAFFKRLPVFANTLPDIFRKLDALRLQPTYRGLKKFRFIEKLERGSSVRAWYDRNKDVLNIYPMAFSLGQRVDASVYAGFGMRHWDLNVSNQDKLTWQKKLVVPHKATIDRFVETVRNRGLTDFKRVIEEFHSANDRLQVIHIVNALVASNVTASDLKTIDVYSHPATSDFCKGLRPYSLIPLVSAYVGEHHLEGYGDAFAYFVMNNGKFHATETSVEASLVNLFEDVTHGARS